MKGGPHGLFKKYKEMIALRGLTEHTIKSYCTYMRAFLDFNDSHLHKYMSEVNYKDLRLFIYHLQATRNLSDRTINTAISQLRFFFIYVLHRPWDPTQLPLRKFDTFLPYVPSREEVEKFISTLTDIKVKAMVSLLYGSGLRIGEVCNLRYEDIQRKTMRIHVCHGKNRSDRFAILANESLNILTEYWFACGRPRGYLFPKQHGQDKPIDTFFLSRHIHAHEDELGWERRITCHSLRHAFGTHLYENCRDLMLVKELMGHKSLASTVIYIHLATADTKEALSPLDKMRGNHNE